MEQLRQVSKPTTTITPVMSGLLQRCTATTECSECRNEREGMLQRAAINSSSVSEVPPIVHEVLHSAGQPLDSRTRAFMEPRFGYDFSSVRVHTDAKAKESARAVNALAYTVGQDVVFSAHESASHSPERRELLAHELAHVVQQRSVDSTMNCTRISQPSDAEEVNAEHLAQSALAGQRNASPVSEVSSPILSRRVIPRLVNCTANVDGAPADPVAELTTIVDRAEGMAIAAAILLRINALLTRQGMRPVGSTVDQAFEDRFGIPPAVGSGFMNRLTGAVRPTLEVALSEEMDLMARRYELIASQLGSGFIHYRCMSTASSFGGCNIPDCSNDAWACPGVNAIFLCPGFWGGDLRTSSTLLIHEASHMIWGSVGHGARGSGGNFRHAECYASFVSDIFGLTPGTPVCPVP